MFWVLKEVEKQTGKKFTNLVSNQSHSKPKSDPAHSAPYSLVLMKQQKEIGIIIWIIMKQKVTFIFHSTQIFLPTSFPENELQIKCRTMFLMSKQACLSEISLVLQKMKIASKSDIHPFYMKAFNCILCTPW